MAKANRRPDHRFICIDVSGRCTWVARLAGASRSRELARFKGGRRRPFAIHTNMSGAIRREDCFVPSGENVEMEKYCDLVRQQRELLHRLAAARDREIDDVIANIVETMLTYHITLDDLRRALPIRSSHAALSKRNAAVMKRPPPKYLDPVSGKTWCGKGRRPAWLVGKDLSEFLLEESVETC
ncbi:MULTISPECIES: H-NS histone family protein [Burkholderia]|uniref:H-NS histone family protein n=1 Tax=Burkholderia TaxID=32008 RepID=UPI001113A430|nr:MULTISPECIES: H-NS histone family protein [Burkholderia]MBH9644245.1 H-NS histone family protein [Burkholderia vietnamiensis]MBR8016601.1 H-NS histone family protein [Burkholderia vietnamiensis]MBR8085885.1 H-NS histone family protein [Burkholderia vietnamiensis]MBR8188897.1 H-NS histone family protein [Burkholderia vietnamiensis]MCA7948517.1 H-NS histone family protein [Burkholderia vietnamiensis]